MQAPEAPEGVLGVLGVLGFGAPDLLQLLECQNLPEVLRTASRGWVSRPRRFRKIFITARPMHLLKACRFLRLGDFGYKP